MRLENPETGGSQAQVQVQVLDTGTFNCPQVVLAASQISALSSITQGVAAPNESALCRNMPCISNKRNLFTSAWRGKTLKLQQTSMRKQ